MTPGGAAELAGLKAGDVIVGVGPRPVRYTTRYTHGLFRENGSAMYVNRGLGVGGPALRINCPREIATIELIAS